MRHREQIMKVIAQVRGGTQEEKVYGVNTHKQIGLKTKDNSSKCGHNLTPPPHFKKKDTNIMGVLI